MIVRKIIDDEKELVRAFSKWWRDHAGIDFPDDEEIKQIAFRAFEAGGTNPNRRVQEELEARAFNRGWDAAREAYQS